MTEGDSTAKPVIKIEGLHFSYPDGKKVLENISFEILPQDRIGIIGPNGAGKTTLFLQICGVLKPSGGQITVLGKPVIDGDFRPDIGLVFQNPDDQLFCPSVRDDVSFGPNNMGLSKATVDARVAEALAGELQEMAGWLGLSGVTVGKRGDLAGALRKAVASPPG